MLYSLFLILILCKLNCGPTPEQKRQKQRHRIQNINFLYSVIYLPNEERNAHLRRNCDKPNALDTEVGRTPILGSYGDLLTTGCFFNKVAQGFIYDAATNNAITVETISASQAFLCKCNSLTTNIFTWERSVVQKTNPVGIITSRIFNRDDRGYSNNSQLVYQTHYKIQDNLFCIPWNCGFNEYRYQFLKIR